MTITAVFDAGTAIGSGRQGGALGTLWAKAGHQVTVGARTPDDAELQTLARETGARVTSPSEAIAASDVVALALPLRCGRQGEPLRVSRVAAIVSADAVAAVIVGAQPVVVVAVAFPLRARRGGEPLRLGRIAAVIGAAAVAAVISVASAIVEIAIPLPCGGRDDDETRRILGIAAVVGASAEAAVIVGLIAQILIALALVVGALIGVGVPAHIVVFALVLIGVLLAVVVVHLPLIGGLGGRVAIGLRIDGRLGEGGRRGGQSHQRDHCGLGVEHDVLRSEVLNGKMRPSHTTAVVRP